VILSSFFWLAFSIFGNFHNQKPTMLVTKMKPYRKISG
jgi:hypothetical protein